MLLITRSTVLPSSLYPCHLLEVFSSRSSPVVHSAVTQSLRGQRSTFTDLSLPSTIQSSFWSEYFPFPYVPETMPINSHSLIHFISPLLHSILFVFSLFKTPHLGCQHFKLLGNTDAEMIFTLESVNTCYQLFLMI